MHTCQLCHKTYTSRNTLARHSRNHDSEKSSTCTKCGRAFHRADLLRRHTAVHQQFRVRRQQTVIACQHCRRSKLKCNGQEPCSSCASRDQQCHYRQEARLAKPARQLEAPSSTSSEALAVAHVEPNNTVSEDIPTPEDLTRLDSFIAQTYFEKLFSTPSTLCPQDSSWVILVHSRSSPLESANRQYTGQSLRDRPSGSATEEPVTLGLGASLQRCLTYVATPLSIFSVWRSS